MPTKDDLQTQIQENNSNSLDSLPDQQKNTLAPAQSLRVAIIGGSNSIMRNGYTKYLQKNLIQKTKCNIEFNNFALGGVSSLFGIIQNRRHNIAKTHDVILFEYCVNDRSAISSGKYNPRMVGMALEGFIRQCLAMNPRCVIIILIFGTNQSNYYNHGCLTSAVYESVARRYKIPVINVTEMLLEKTGIQFIKNLYDNDDSAHYKRPGGVRRVAKLIAEQIIEQQLLEIEERKLSQYHRMYAGNLQNLQSFCNFDAALDSHGIEKSLYKNSFFEEAAYTIRGNYCLNFSLKGKLLGLMLKSDWYDGLIKIILGDRELITSSFSKYVKGESQSNLNLLSLPYFRSFSCKTFTKLSIAVCESQPQEYQLDLCKTQPKLPPQDWKFSIIGIAYTGSLTLLDNTYNN